MKSVRRFSFYTFLLLALIFSLYLMACAPAATPMPVTEAPAATRSSAPTEAPPIIKTAVPVSTAAPISVPAIQETRLLTLDFPPRIRAGDSDVVRLTLEMDENGNLTPTISQSGNVSSGQIVYVPNVFDSYDVMAEAKLEMAGLDVRPNETVSETLTPRQKITFYWSVLPNDVGVYKGVLYFYLHFIPKTSGVESRKLLWAQVVQIEATSFLGLQANPTRWLGLVGTVFSSVLGMPFLESILKYLWKSRFQHGWKRLRGRPGPVAGQKKRSAGA